MIERSSLDSKTREESFGLLAHDDFANEKAAALHDNLLLEHAAQEETIGLHRGIPSLKRQHHLGGMHSTLAGLVGLVLECLRRFAVFLLPSFVAARWFRSPKGQAPPEKVRLTAYLDGLRGVAAWSVLNAHLSATLQRSSGAGWGHPGPGGNNPEIYKLPFLRLVYDGEFAVALFFAISGFALSISVVSAMRKQTRDPAAFMAKLSGAIFRRPFRLYAPSWVSTFVVFVLIRLGYFQYFLAREPEFQQLVDGWPLLANWPGKHPSFWTQFYDMVKGDLDMLMIFANSIDDSFQLRYNGVLWTIKLEFRASLVLMLTHGALFYCRKPVRTVITIGLMLIGVWVWSFDFPLFWAGYLIAEYSPFTAAEVRKGPGGKVGFLRAAFWWLLLIPGLFLGSYAPWQPEVTPFFSWMVGLTGFIPEDRLYTAIGAVLTVLSISKLPTLRKFFSSPVIHYLGQISFSLYLVHFWLVQGLGLMLFHHAWAITGKANEFTTFVGFCMAYSVLLGVAIWVADIFWRVVDVPLVNVAAKVQKRLFQEL